MESVKRQKFLITGGSGFLGINLTRYLVKRGHKVVIYDIVSFDYEDMVDEVQVVNGDIRNLGDLETACEDVDIIVHCAAALPLYKEEVIYATDVEGTGNVLKAAEVNNVERIIHISSTAVYGIPDHHPLYESDKLEGVGPYGTAKIDAKKVCEKYRENGMCIPIIRPKSFIGPERLGVFAIYYDWIKSKKNVPIVGNRKNKYQLLDVEDLCDAIYLCASKDKTIVNDTFNIGAREYTTMKEDFGEILSYAGFGKRIITTPAKPLILVLCLLEFFKLSPLYKWVYETAPEDSFVSIEKAEKVLEFKPKYSNKQA
ncbi:NAD-dependent epimerase/dehydratase family protein [uncultured Methanobacterium sp.]|uniref:NAD-dependent epimerase/dehydratase family protein n=1 Tax=uncultured Methanobacterium sp. TaxID=176306 RepID=UPI002AA95F48|nr:NAD-dependent epimerase/dehydratase family protein [uncultured Methanobacterium sp.]